MPREIKGKKTGNVVSWKPMKENIWSREFCDVECCKREQEVGTWKMPRRFSDEKISGDPSKSSLSAVLRQKQNTAS